MVSQEVILNQALARNKTLQEDNDNLNHILTKTYEAFEKLETHPKYSEACLFLMKYLPITKCP